jgi:hypothetical protein
VKHAKNLLLTVSKRKKVGEAVRRERVRLRKTFNEAGIGKNKLQLFSGCSFSIKLLEKFA